MTADQLQLITAAVDGELSPAEDRAFRLLVASSVEARTLFAKLKADSERIAALPRVAPPVDLPAKILARLASAAPHAKSQPLAEPAHASPTAMPPRRTPGWVPVAVAASVLICVTTGSFAFFNAQSGSKNAVVKGYWSNTLPVAEESQPAAPSPTAPRAERPDAAAAVRIAVSPVPPAPAPRAVPHDEVAVAPSPRLAAPDLIGFPVMPKLPPFERVELRLPFLRPVVDLAREDVGQELTDHLGRDSAFKFDLFVRDTARGAEVFRNAAKAAGLAVFTDAATTDKLKKKQAHAVVIYTESLTAAELTALFAALAGEDAKFSPRVCDSLHATSVVRSEEVELKAILGLDVGLFKRPSGTSGAGQGGEKNREPKSVSAGTIDSVVKSVAKSGDKSAVLLTWQTTHASLARTNPAMSAELKQFLAKRGERKPNAVPAIIVIRPTG